MEGKETEKEGEKLKMSAMNETRSRRRESGQ
jgi:hypothetical protein